MQHETLIISAVDGSHRCDSHSVHFIPGKSPSEILSGPQSHSGYSKGKGKLQKGSRSLYSFFNLVARWGGWSTMPQPLYPWGRPSTHFIGGWVGPRANLDGRGKSPPSRIRYPGRLTHNESPY